MEMHKENIFYYDQIANEYDKITKDKNNTIIRERMEEKFKSIVSNGLVLDFGGGTGLDLEWLTSNNYRVIFCEPSNKMKEIAIDNYKQNNQILFLHTPQTDFHNWSSQLPFAEKVDAVLCNFAVLNCIADIKTFFKNLATVMRPGADFIALILDNGFEKMMKQSKRKAVSSLIFHLPFKFYIHYNQHRQTVYIHTDKAIKDASEKFFEFKNKERWDKHGFCWIHLVRK